jgi:hypothetical protein
MEGLLYTALLIILIFVLVYLNNKAKDGDKFATNLIIAIVIFLAIGTILLAKP